MDRGMNTKLIGRTAAAGVLLLTAGCFAENRTGVSSSQTALPADTALAAAPAVQPTKPEAKPAKPARKASKPKQKPVKTASAESTQFISRSAPGSAIRAPKWQVGDRWRYNDGYGLRVESIDGDLVTMRRLDDPDQWLIRRGFLREMSQSSTALRQVTYRSVAADAGMWLSKSRPLVFTREYTSNRRTLVHNTSWVVEGEERITVPAGSFNTTIIVMRTRNAATGWTGFERWWYAPEVRNYVRMEYRYGKQPIGSRVLTSFEPAGTRVSKADPTLSVPAPRMKIRQ